METALEKYALLETSGSYSDGESAQSHDVVVKFGATSLTLYNTNGSPLTHWALASLRAQGDQADREALTLAPDQDSNARLLVQDEEMIAALRQVCPDLYKRRPPNRLMRRVLLWGSGAVASVLLIVFVFIPAIAGQLALLIPPEREQAMGEEVLSQIRSALGRFGGEQVRTCTAPAGVTALNRMVERLAPHVDSHVPFSVQVFDHPMVNAFAVPGGHIVLFRGLLDRADTPEEVAGVLAHEMGHVINRDPTRMSLQSAGSVGILGLLLGDFAGGAVILVLTERLIQATYSQEAEAEADIVSHLAMTDAGLPLEPFAGFFEKLAEKSGEQNSLLSHLASHPDLASRARAARDADKIGETPFIPVLDDQDWIALSGICEETD